MLYIYIIYMSNIYIYMLSPGSGSNQRENKAPRGNCSFIIGTNMDYSIVSIIIIWENLLKENDLPNTSL